jgi:thiosulfate/3-mercaptopyruvate sulfurtransferase
MTNILSKIACSVLLLESVGFADLRQEQGQEYSWDCPGSGFLQYRRELLVTTAELAQLLEDSEVTVIHVGFDTSGEGTVRRSSYSDGHIPGARHLIWPDLKGSGETLLPAESRWPALAALGLPRDGRVVVYDTGLGLEAAAAFVALESLGFSGRIALLDGQWVKWIAEGRPFCRWGAEGVPADLEPSPSSVALVPAEVEPLVGEALRPRPSVTLVDARGRFRGGPLLASTAPFKRMAWPQNLASLNWPVFKSEVELRQLWASVPSRSDHRVVVGARHWRESAHTYFVARLLGYSVQLLDGSIEDLEQSMMTLERGS